MNVNGLVKASIPVILGVIAAGLIMNYTRRSVPLIQAAADGYDQ